MKKKNKIKIKIHACMQVVSGSAVVVLTSLRPASGVDHQNPVRTSKTKPKNEWESVCAQAACQVGDSSRGDG